MSLSNPCEHIQAIFDCMQKADKEVADGKITEGLYMTRSERLKNEFEFTVSPCCKKCIYCGDKCDKKEEEEESDSDDEIEVFPYENFRIDYIENLPAEIKQDWKNKYGNGYIDVFVGEEEGHNRVWDANTEDLLENVKWEYCLVNKEYKFEFVSFS